MKLKKGVSKTLFIASGVILFWRGSWGLMDYYIVPNNPLVSNVISLTLGLAILVYTHHLDDSLR